MKICVLTDIFPSVSETWVKEEVRWLSKNGHDAAVAAREIGEVSTWKARFLSVPVSQSLPRLFVEAMRGAMLGPWRYPSRLLNKWREVGLRRTLQGLARTLHFRQSAFDVIHAHFGSVGEQYSFLPDALGLPMVVTFHGYDLRRGERTRGRVYGSLFQAAKAVIAISEYSKRRLLEFGCPEEKIVLARMGIELGGFSPAPTLTDEKDFRIITVARLAQEKNLSLAIRTVARLQELLPGVRVRYRIVGDGPLREELENLAQSRGVTLELPGAQTPERVAEELRGSHAFLLSSEKEVAPVSILEAMGCGLPVVATNVGAVSELVEEGGTGFVRESGDGLAMAECLARLAQNKELRRTMGQTARKRAEQMFDFEKQMKALVSLFEKEAS